VSLIQLQAQAPDLKGCSFPSSCAVARPGNLGNNGLTVINGIGVCHLAAVA
jgi:hypothetical protein